MDSAQQSRLCSSPSSLPLEILKEPTVSDEENESQLCLAKKLKPKTTTGDAGSNIQIIEGNVNTDPATETERGTPDLLHPNSSVSPAEGVFSIDHLLESILFECDMRTLLGCRHVCRRWAYYGSKALQRRVDTITFVHRFDHRRNKPGGFQYKPYRLFCIDELTACMIDSPEFPCNSFCFSNSTGGYGSYTPQPFLNAHGARIKKLEFYGTLNLDHVRQILLTQVPKLEQLILTHIRILDKPSQIVNTKTARERAIYSKALFNGVNNFERKQIFKHLKVFEGNSSIPKLFTQQILEQSPNMIEAAVPMEYFELLLKPVNRVHLLKKLVIQINVENIAALELVANYNGDNLALKEIQFVDFDSSNDVNGNLHRRGVESMNKILEASRHSCQALKLSRFLKNLKVPNKMPQVKHLTVDFDEEDESDDVVDVELPLPVPVPVPVNAFPKGINLAETFPNLTTLTIGASYNETRTIQNFVREDGSSQLPAPALSVRNVNFGFRPQPDGPVLSHFSELFPYASFKLVRRAESEVEYDE